MVDKRHLLINDREQIKNISAYAILAWIIHPFWCKFSITIYLSDHVIPWMTPRLIHSVIGYEADLWLIVTSRWIRIKLLPASKTHACIRCNSPSRLNVRKAPLKLWRDLYSITTLDSCIWMTHTVRWRRHHPINNNVNVFECRLE